MERARGEEKREGEVGGKEGGRWILLGERWGDTGFCEIHHTSEGEVGGVFSCRSVYRLAIGFGLGFFFLAFEFRFFDFPGLSVGALCFVMNSLCATFPFFSVPFVILHEL